MRSVRMRILRDARAKLALLVRSEEDYSAILLNGTEHEHLRAEVCDLLWREVHHRQQGPTCEFVLCVPWLNRRGRLLHAERSEVDRELVRRVSCLGEIVHRQNAADAHVDLPELVPREVHGLTGLAAVSGGLRCSPRGADTAAGGPPATPTPRTSIPRSYPRPSP